LTVVRGGSFNSISTNTLGARGYQDFNSFTYTNNVGVGLRIVSP